MYLFGLTYEEQVEGQNQKARVLLVKESRLEYLRDIIHRLTLDAEDLDMEKLTAPSKFTKKSQEKLGDIR